jgi:hypothetical protein
MINFSTDTLNITLNTAKLRRFQCLRAILVAAHFYKQQKQQNPKQKETKHLQSPDDWINPEPKKLQI